MTNITDEQVKAALLVIAKRSSFSPIPSWLMRAALEAADAAAWMPIEEYEKNRHGKQVLAYSEEYETPNQNLKAIAVVQYNSKQDAGYLHGWWGWTADGIVIQRPTHFRPLREPPKEPR